MIWPRGECIHRYIPLNSNEFQMQERTRTVAQRTDQNCVLLTFAKLLMCLFTKYFIVRDVTDRSGRAVPCGEFMNQCGRRWRSQRNSVCVCVCFGE
jgi:hypothetical protein